MVRTQCFHGKEHGFNPLAVGGEGTKIPGDMRQGQKQETKEKNNGHLFLQV